MLVAREREKKSRKEEAIGKGKGKVESLLLRFSPKNSLLNTQCLTRQNIEKVFTLVSIWKRFSRDKSLHSYIAFFLLSVMHQLSMNSKDFVDSLTRNASSLVKDMTPPCCCFCSS